jgi:hypothetical protein
MLGQPVAPIWLSIRRQKVIRRLFKDCIKVKETIVCKAKGYYYLHEGIFVSICNTISCQSHGPSSQRDWHFPWQVLFAHVHARQNWENWQFFLAREPIIVSKLYSHVSFWTRKICSCASSMVLADKRRPKTCQGKRIVIGKLTCWRWNQGNFSTKTCSSVRGLNEWMTK